MIVEILNKNLEAIGAIEKITSLQWQRRYIECGEFEIHVPLSMEYLEMLQVGHYVVLRYKDETGMILYRQLSQNDNGQETIVVRGKVVKELLKRRIIWGTEYLKGTAGAMFSKIITNHCIDPIDVKRKITNISCSILAQGKEIQLQTSYANLMEECEKICLLGDIGYRAEYDHLHKGFVFTTYQGKNRSINQSENDPIVFSDEYENVSNQSYIYSVMNYANVVLTAGIGDGKDRKTTQIGNASGVERYEIFDDQRGLTNMKEDGTSEYSDDEYCELLKSSGQSVLNDHLIVEQYTFKNAQKSNYQYLQDYDLGDTVTCVKSNWGISIDTQIIGVNEIYEQSGMEIDLVFGNELPTLMKKIKKLR